MTKQKIIDQIKSLEIFYRGFGSFFMLGIFQEDKNSTFPLDWVINLGFFGIRKWKDAETKNYYIKIRYDR